VDVWTWPDDSAYADSVPFHEVTSVVDVLTRIVGPFPYEKLSHIESATKYGGMENASAIFYNEKPYADRSMHEGVVRHETAHQWFGDAVTEKDFHHLWLSEGFADYFDLVAGAALHGDSILTKGMQAYAASYFKSPVVDRPLVDTAQADPAKLLNANNYQKGAWVLHMLRHEVGDSAFFRGVRDYYVAWRDSSVLSAQFQTAIEKRSRKNLDWFFKEWLWQPGYPQVTATWHYEPFKRQAIVHTQETQVPAWGLFRLTDVPVEFANADGKTVRRTIDINGPPSTQGMDLPWTPTTMRVDPDGNFLLTVTVTTEAKP
jgi:aminopeptidase N